MSENEIEEIQSHQKRIKSNIGDNIQSIASERFLPVIDKRFNRDALNQVQEEEKFLLIMNGWYTHMPENWPPSESIIPVFIGFHITESYHVKKLLLSEESIVIINEMNQLDAGIRKPLNYSPIEGLKHIIANV